MKVNDIVDLVSSAEEENSIGDVTVAAFLNIKGAYDMLEHMQYCRLYAIMKFTLKYIAGLWGT